MIFQEPRIRAAFLFAATPNGFQKFPLEDAKEQVLLLHLIAELVSTVSLAAGGHQCLSKVALSTPKIAEEWLRCFPLEFNCVR
ncbi:MAG TPA: hypothetical protein VFA76_03285 [Terriglobales bacterium]|nr:hypothetical protein [Terriglobales bacterium]